MHKLFAYEKAVFFSVAVFEYRRVSHHHEPAIVSRRSKSLGRLGKASTLRIACACSAGTTGAVRVGSAGGAWVALRPASFGTVNGERGSLGAIWLHPEFTNHIIVGKDV